LGTWFGKALRFEESRDDLLKSICESIDLLVDDCERFWGFSTGELGTDRVRLGSRIQGRLHSINSLQNQLLTPGSIGLKNTQEEWRALHRAATGGNYDEDERDADAARLTAIFQIAWDMRRGITLRRNQLPRSIIIPTCIDQNS